jgi:hypothetical protein
MARSRRLATSAVTALGIIAECRGERIPRASFDFLMGEQGVNAVSTRSTVTVLVRAGWVTTSDQGALLVTEAGRLAATQGIGVPTKPRHTASPGKRGLRRMPRSLLLG